MEAFGVYLLKSMVWLTGFALVYLLFLRYERFFQLKRIYLLTGIIVSLIFPAISIHYTVELPVPAVTGFVPAGTDLPANSVIPAVAHTTPFDYKFILLVLYVSGILFLGYRIIYHMILLRKAINKANINSIGPVRLVRISSFPASFSFFNYVFINPSVDEAEVREIMNHELVHVHQKHWLDLLLIEMLRLFQWVNPFVWIYTGFIRLNNEYLADELALQRSLNPGNYKAALMNQLFRSPVISLSSSFNYSLNKKRFDMMKKTLTSPYRKLKVLLVLPVFAIILYAFAVPEYNYLSAESSFNSPTIPEILPPAQNVVKGKVVDENGKPLNLVTIASNVTGTGTPTGTDGRFSLINISENESLLFSCIGYKDQMLKPGFTSDMVIKMVKDPDYKRTVMTPDAIFRHEGENVTIRITDDKNSESLIVIDDKISNSRGEVTLKRDDIGSIAVLKGKDATDKYGEKGKNGVIVITMKSKTPAGPSPAQLQMPPRIVTIDGVITDKTPEGARKELGYNYGIMNISRGGMMDTVKIITRKKAIEMGLRPPFPRLAPEDYPSFQGRHFSAFQTWLTSQLKYPSEAQAQNIEGWVSVNFKVLLDGTLSDIQSTIPVNPLLSDAVIRQINSSPKWDPPKNPDVDEPFTNSITLRFKLPDQILTEPPSVVVEEMPMYPGGDAALLDFINKNTRYPEEAKSQKIEGRVIVRFVVSDEGKTEAISVLKGVHPLLDSEAIRVVSSFDKFEPGKQGGKPVNVWYMVPITFTLNKPDTPQ